MKLSCYICHQRITENHNINIVNAYELDVYSQYELEDHLRTHTIDEVISAMARMHWSIGLGTFEREYGIKSKNKK